MSSLVLTEIIYYRKLKDLFHKWSGTNTWAIAHFIPMTRLLRDTLYPLKCIKFMHNKIYIILPYKMWEKVSPRSSVWQLSHVLES